MKKNLGELVEEFSNLKTRKDELNQQVKDINAELDQVEYLIIKELEEQGVDRTSTQYGTASLKVEMYPQVEDMESFVQWCADNGRPDMIQKRVAKQAFDEYFEENNEFPDGIKTYEKRSLNFRRR